MAPAGLPRRRQGVFPAPDTNAGGREVRLPFANQEALEPPFSGRTKQT